MDLSLQDSIIGLHDSSLSWNQKFVIPHGTEQVNLAPACGEHALPPAFAPGQPPRFYISSVYRFDNTAYKGIEKWTNLHQMLKENLPGANFILLRGCQKLSKNRRWVLSCSHSLSAEDVMKKNFEGSDDYTQKGVISQSVKNRTSQGEGTSLDRMASKKEKNT